MANTKVTGDLIASSTIATGNIADNAVTSDKISGITTAHITEGSNLYYTDARADARITTATTSDLTEGTNLYYTNARTDARVNLQTGANLSLSNKSTSDLSEGTNLYYTDARADARAALLVGSAPSTLDTLNELAAALGDDPNFAATTATNIGLKAPLASPSFTGIITANSSSSGDYVRLYGSSGTGKWDIYGNGANLRISDNESAGILAVDRGATFGGNVDVTGSIIARVNANYYSTKNYLGDTWEFASDTADGVTFKITGGAANTTGNFFKFQTQAGGATPATALIINKNGKVGIGEPVPLKPLHVKAPDAAGNIRLTRAGTTEYHDIGTYYSYTNGNSADFGTTSAHKTFLTTRTYNALEINSDQEVSLLGYRGADGFALPHDQNTGYSNFSAGGFGILFREAADNYLLGNAYYYKTGGAAAWKAKYASGGTMIASNVGEITFQTATSVAAGATLTFDPKMIIKNDGKVGIGVTDPDCKLEIKGIGGSTGLTFKTTDASSNETFFIQDGGRTGVRYWPFSIGIPSGTALATNAVFQVEEAGLFTLLTTGKVGIGTTSPDYPLEINSSVGGGGMLSVMSASTEASISHRVSSGGTGTGWVTGNASNNYFIYSYTKGSQVMTFLPSGEVGIGITNPTAKLHVNGGAIIGSTRFGDSAAASINTTGYIVATVPASSNGQSAVVEFIATGGAGAYYNVVYTCYNGAGNWYYNKNVVGSGGSIEVAETNGSGSSTLVFYFRATSGAQGYTPRVMMKGTPYALVTF